MCLDELQSLEYSEVLAQSKLKVAQAFLTAVENSSDAVEIMSESHEIQVCWFCLLESSVLLVSGVYLVWKLSGGGRGSRFKIWGSWVLKVQQTEARSTWLRVSSPEFVFNIHSSFNFYKVTKFRKCSHLISLYIIAYNNISWNPTTPIPKSGGRDPLILQDWRLCFLWSVDEEDGMKYCGADVEHCR